MVRLALDFALEFLSEKHSAQKKKGPGGADNIISDKVPSNDVMPGKKEEQRIPTHFLRTSLFSSFAAAESAVLARSGEMKQDVFRVATWKWSWVRGRRQLT